jgi:hypothetical protein
MLLILSALLTNPCVLRLMVLVGTAAVSTGGDDCGSFCRILAAIRSWKAN